MPFGPVIINARVKSMFFDRASVVKALDKKTRRAMGKAGAYVRKVSAGSIRRPTGKNAVSKPGEAPRSASRILPRSIFFGYDSGSESVVVGPVFKKRGNVPNLLEFGGKVDRGLPVWKTRNGRKVIERKKIKANYEARPYMGPGLDKAAAGGKLAGFWGGSLRG